MTHQILQPAGWPRPKGYANGVAATIAPEGRLVFTAGVVGWDAQSAFPEGLTAQAAQAFANIVAILAEAGAEPAHVVRMTWYVTSRQAYLDEAPAIGAAYRAAFGKLFPAMAVVEVSALMEAAAMIEIEATAVVPG
ncbi:RidA family protein [Polymorphobacter sp.]|uniref:RidA family protein n=1 Tax=Polymorphobacter sp. TaxID=1909290 RepID=UPI003F726315